MVATYLIVCLQRFVDAQAFPSSSAFLNPDALSGRLLPRHLRLVGFCLGTLFRLLPILRRLFTKVLPTTKAGSMTARTHFLDESVRLAVADGAQQLVILGAGFDTRPARLRQILGNVRLFEVDLPSTQAAKRAVLQRAGLADEWGSVFVPVDFRNAGWMEALRQAGCKLGSTRTHVLWEGCIYYLTDQAVAATLRAFRKPGVSLSFDLFSKDVGINSEDNGVRSMSRYVRSIGEPVLFGINFDGLRDWASEHGWDVTDGLLRPEDITDRFFPDLEADHEPYSYHGMVSMRPASS